MSDRANISSLGFHSGGCPQKPPGTNVPAGRRFSDNMYSQLRELAKREHTSISAIVRAATETYLNSRLNRTP